MDLSYYIREKEYLMSLVNQLGTDNCDEDILCELYRLYDMIDENDEIIKRISGWYDTLIDTLGDQE